MKTITQWPAAILDGGAPSIRWTAIFDHLANLCDSTIPSADLERALETGDRVLAEAAWDLWRDYPDHAPSAAKAAHTWWDDQTPGTGRAILILDSLSVREAHLLLEAAVERGVAPTAVAVHGAAVPTDTTAFARSLGLSQRSQLKSSLPGSFKFACSGLHTDVPDGADFGTLATTLPPVASVLIWCSWPDEAIHVLRDKPRAAERVAALARATFWSDGFWSLIEMLRRGRSLLLMSDHGYAVSQRFVEMPPTLAEPVRAAFGAQRCGSVPAVEINLVARQPLYVVADGRAALIGPRKWRAPGGFPHLGHGGLTLAEVSVPFITFSPV